MGVSRDGGFEGWGFQGMGVSRDGGFEGWGFQGFRAWRLGPFSNSRIEGLGVGTFLWSPFSSASPAAVHI